MSAAPSSIKVSVIVPCYKAEKYLSRCLDSLLNQTLNGVEIVAVNDGSPDNCIGILRDYQQRHGDSFVVIDKKNEGAWAARRDGIAAARGCFIGFVDADDYVTPEFCESLYACAIKHDADIAVCGFYREDASTGQVFSEELARHAAPFNAQEETARLLELNTAPWNKLFRADLLKHMTNIQEPPPIFEDVIMHLLAFPRTRRVAFTGSALVHYLVRENSLMTSITMKQIGATYQALIEAKEIVEREGASATMMNLIAAEAFLHLGISLMFRISYDRTADLKAVLRENRSYLDEHFPAWKSGAIISFSHALKYRGANLKVWLGRLVYRAHLMRAALGAYRFMIEKMGKDIKW